MTVLVFYDIIENSTFLHIKKLSCLEFSKLTERCFMVKKVKIFSLLLFVFIFFFSCSKSVEVTNLSFNIPSNFSRAIVDDDSDDWTLKIILSGDISLEKEVSISLDDSPKEIVFENLEVDKQITIDAKIFKGEELFYKAEKTQSITLSSGDNFVNIHFIRETSSIDIDISSEIPLIIEGFENINDEITIPYMKECKISLNTEKDFDSYKWTLNGNELDEFTEKEINFMPAENDYVEPEKTNVLVCVFSDENGNYFSEIKFNLNVENE